MISQGRVILLRTIKVRKETKSLYNLFVYTSVYTIPVIPVFKNLVSCIHFFFAFSISKRRMSFLFLAVQEEMDRSGGIFCPSFLTENGKGITNICTYMLVFINKFVPEETCVTE